MKRFIFLGIIALTVMMISGCIFDSDNDKKSDSVKKGSVSGTVKTTVTDEPVAGIKVMLIDRSVKGDSTTLRNSVKAFVDSAITDAGGKYVIDNIAPGNYGVYPVNADTTVTYKFAVSASPDSCAFQINGESRSVNFTAEKLSVPAWSDEDAIGDYVYLQNGTATFGKSERRMWIFFIPFPVDGTTLWFEKLDSGEQWFKQIYDPGYTVLAATLDNCQTYEITYDNGKKRSFTIYHNLGTPANSKFYYNYDLSTGVLTERK